MSIERLIGSQFNDTLIGNSFNNTLAGFGGNDFLDGRDGIDTADFSRYSPDVGRLVEGVPSFLVVHLGAHDAAGTAVESISGGTTTQTVTTLVSIENVIGADFVPNQLFGNEKDNVLTGGSLSDALLDGGLGNDTLIGGGRSDTASYASHNSLSGEFGTISLGPSNSVAGHANYFIPLVFNGFQTAQNVETDTLFGIENITGSNLNETLNGNAADNILDGGLGNDTLVGNGGHDTASYVSHDTGSVSLGESDTISLGLNDADGSFTRSQLNQVLELDVLRGITNVTGSNRSETINGNEKDNILAGRGGSNTINGGLGNDTYDFRGSAQGNDRFFDSGGSDKILIFGFSEILGSDPVDKNGNESNNGPDLKFTLTAGIFTIVNHFAGDPIETLVDAKGKIHGHRHRLIGR